MSVNYDKQSDVMYVSFGKPQCGIADEMEHGIFIRKDLSGNKIIGITFLDFKENFQNLIA